MQKVSNKMNPKRPTPRHIIIKMAKVKDKKKNFKLVREKESHIKGDPPNAVSFSRNSDGVEVVFRLFLGMTRRTAAHRQV